MSLEARLIHGAGGPVVDHIPTADIDRGKIVHRGKGQLGIAHTDIPANVHGGLAIGGAVYELPKETGKAFAVGDPIYWDLTASKASPKGGIFFGYCIRAAATSASVVRASFCPEQTPQLPMAVRVDSATVIAVGDLLFLDTDDAKPAGDFTWNTNIATTQAGFAAVFLGVAMQSSADGSTDPILADVSPASIYEFATNSATYEVGAMLGPDKAAGDALLSSTLEAAVAGSSIARAREYKASAATILKVSFASAYGMDNLNAEIG